MAERTKSESSAKFELAQVATEHALVYKDTESGEELDMQQAILRLLNNTEELKKLIA